MVQLADGSVLASAGELRNEVFRFGKDGGRSTTPLFELDSPVLDMAVDALGQLWVMTGGELLLVDADQRRRDRAPHRARRRPARRTPSPSTPTAGEIYVSSGNGIEIFDPNAADPAQPWQHFSQHARRRPRVRPRRPPVGRALDRQRHPRRQARRARPRSSACPMTGRTAGRAEVEYRIAGIVDSIAFGRAGSPLAGVLLAIEQSRAARGRRRRRRRRAARRQRLDDRARIAPRAPARPGRHARREHPDDRRRPHPRRARPTRSTRSRR